jgi:DNA-binding transcriptional MocR family regulator
MPDAHKKRLVDLLAKRDIPLIEDDLYGELHFGPVRPKAAKAFDRKGLVLYCSSFSKCLWPGARVGWAAAGRFHDKVSVLKQMSSISTPTLPQRVIAEYMDDGGYDRHLRSLRRALERQMRQVAAAVRAHFPEGTRMTRPEGGFVLWIELPEGSDSLRLDAEARKAGISIAPGPMFSAHLGHRAFLRLSCGNPWSERIEKAVIRLGLLAKDQAKDPLRARPRPR